MASSRPTIAVAIPTMNRKGMLREAVRSALNQTRPPDEIFISDNSPEPDRELLEEFAGAPLRYHCHDRKLHIEEHWKWCLSQPRTDYVAWLEDDNLLRPDHLAHLADAAERFPQAALVGSVGVVFHEQRSSWQRTIFAPVWPFDHLTREPIHVPADLALATYFFGSPIASSAVMIRRSLLDEPGAFVDCHCWMPLDRWLWAQFAALGGVAFAPQPTLLYREHGSNHTKSIKRRAHMSENLRVSTLILEKMNALGIDPEAAVRRLATDLDKRGRDLCALELLRSRNRVWIRRFLPLLLGESSLGPCLGRAAGLYLRTKMAPRLGFA